MIGHGSGAEGRIDTGVEATCSRSCARGMCVASPSNILLVMSAIVSVTAEKAGGDSVHPMGKTVGTATNFGSVGRLGNGTANFYAPVGVRGIR